MIYRLIRLLIIFAIFLVSCKIFFMLVVQRIYYHMKAKRDLNIILDSLFLLYVDGENSLAYFSSKEIDFKDIKLPYWNESIQKLGSEEREIIQMRLRKIEEVIELKFKQTDFIKIGEDYIMNSRSKERLDKFDTLNKFLNFMENKNYSPLI